MWSMIGSLEPFKAIDTISGLKVASEGGEVEVVGIPKIFGLSLPLVQRERALR